MIVGLALMGGAMWEAMRLSQAHPLFSQYGFLGVVVTLDIYVLWLALALGATIDSLRILTHKLSSAIVRRYGGAKA